MSKREGMTFGSGHDLSNIQITNTKVVISQGYPRHATSWVTEKGSLDHNFSKLGERWPPEVLKVAISAILSLNSRF